MSNTTMYKLPQIDSTPASMLKLAQLGFFCVFAYWGVDDAESTIDWVWPIIMISAGLSLYLSVPNSRIGATLGIPLIMVVMGVIMDELDMAFWAIFMLVIVGSLAYIPALALGDESLNIDDKSRITRFKILYSLFAIMMVFLFSVLAPAAMDGTFEDDGEDPVVEYQLESTDQTIAQAGFAMAIVGVLIFLGTGVFGLRLGPMNPWHGGAMISSGVFADSYLWMAVADTGFADFLFALAASGIFTLSALVAFQQDDITESE